MNFLECGNFTVVAKPILVERKKNTTPTAMIITEEELRVYEEKLEKRKEVKDLSQYNKVNKPYKCTICNLKFASKPYLNRHDKNIHDLKRFECEICYKIYNGREKLKCHMRQIHNIYANQCQQCGLKVRNKACLMKHIKNDHTSQY